MALTKVSRGLLSTSIVDNGNATAITIDASENVGIGVTPEAWTVFNPVLQIGGGAIAGSSATNFRVFSNTYYAGSYKRIATGAVTQYEQADGLHVWYSNASGSADSTFTPDEHMRIDSSGNLLVGTTNTYPADNNATGHSLTAVGQLQSSVSGFAAFIANRKSSNGDIAIFKKDGSTVGSIGTKDSNLFIGTGDTGVRFSSGTDSVFPIDTSTGNGRDAAVDLGLGSGGRFKDLYLSGGAYLGGTAAANKLDDYESGTLTMIGFSTVVGLTAVSHSYAHYVKVGQMITIWGRVNVTPSATGRIAWVMNTPFSVSSVSNTGQNGVLVAYPYATSNASGYVIDNSGGDATSFYCETNITNTSLAGISYCISYLTT